MKHVKNSKITLEQDITDNFVTTIELYGEYLTAYKSTPQLIQVFIETMNISSEPG